MALALGAIAAGGVLGATLLMYGLTRVSAADASLLLNLEAVLTAHLAWVVFRGNGIRTNTATTPSRTLILTTPISTIDIGTEREHGRGPAPVVAGPTNMLRV